MKVVAHQDDFEEWVSTFNQRYSKGDDEWWNTFLKQELGLDVNEEEK